MRHVSARHLIVSALLLSAAGATRASPWGDPFDETRAFQAYATGNYTAALDLYERLGGYRGAMGVGVAAFRLGRLDRAHEAFREAARLARTDEEHARAAYDLGNALARLGRFEAARKAYREALRWRPEHAHARRNLALLARIEHPGAGRRQGRDRAAATRPGHNERPLDKADEGGGDRPRGPSPATDVPDDDRRIERALERWRASVIRRLPVRPDDPRAGSKGASRSDAGLAEALFRLESLTTDLRPTIRYRIGQAEARLEGSLPMVMPPW